MFIPSLSIPKVYGQPTKLPYEVFEDPTILFSIEPSEVYSSPIQSPWDEEEEPVESHAFPSPAPTPKSYDTDITNITLPSQNTGLVIPETRLENTILFRYPYLDCPNSSLINKRFTFYVQILIESPEPGIKAIRIEDKGIPDKLPEVEIVLRAKGFDIQGSNTKMIQVEREDDAEERFVLIPRQLGEQEIRVDFYQNGRRIGTARKNIIILAEAESKNVEVSQPQTQTPLEIKNQFLVPPPDLELCVQLDKRDRQTLDFTLHSTKSEIDFHHKKVGQVILYHFSKVMRDLVKEKEIKYILMSGVPKIKIAESVEELKMLMKQQKTGLGYAKIQSLYLLKISAVETVRHLAIIIGRGESTIHRWLHQYKIGGISLLLSEPPKTGRPQKLDIETVAKIQQELSDSQGFNSYQEIKLWLLVCHNIDISYPTIHRIVRYELRGKLKVPRPIHEKQQPGVIEAFKSHLPNRIEGLINDIRDKNGQAVSISYWFQDETRLGYRTESGHKITKVGVKPTQILQWYYNYYYIYGLVDPVQGRSFL